VSIFTKRNALVGYLTLKRLEWKWRHRRSWGTLKVVALVALALVSAGILAGLVAVALRRQREIGEPEEGQRLEGFASADDEDLAELGAGLPEPGFAA
jgi:hypothetical protein